MKRLFAVVCVLGLLQSPATAMAQAGIAAQVGVKLITTVVGALAGEGFDSIFGDDGPQPLTAEELGAALDKSLAKSFRSEYLKTTLDQVTELQINVREYNSDGSVASRREQIDAIIHNADKIRGAIQNRIHHGQFFKLLPDFMMATNTWFAFQTERKFVTVNEDASPAKRKAAYEHQNQIVAFEVVHALGLLHDMYYHDFIDTGTRGCDSHGHGGIYMKPGQLITDFRGKDILKWAGGRGWGAPLQFCVQFMHKFPYGNLAVNKNWFNNFRVFEKHRNEWVYTAKTKGKYTYYGPFKTKAEAEASRVARAMMSYRDILGDIPGMVRQWEKLVLAIGTDQNKSDAIRLVKELGVRR